MTERTTDDPSRRPLDLPPIEPADEFAAQIADQVESFLIALRAWRSRAMPAAASRSCCSRSARSCSPAPGSGPRSTSRREEDYQPDVGPDADLDGLRLRLADLFGNIDTYSFVFDPYDPEQVNSQLSDDLTSIASDLENGLRHFRLGNIAEALWWWQFSYVSSWGNLAGAALNALLSVVAHDRLDVEFTGETDQVAAANEMLESPPDTPR